ncbi:hypothetical protein DV736_g1984, partial [Chaetothyriales sp. CBS 134916]
MAGGREAISFDEIIQAGRARSRNEQLASEIFGRNRKTREANDRSNRSSSRTPSLASRAGVQKSQRSSSSSSTATQRPPPVSRTSSVVQAVRTSRIQSALESPSASQANISKSRGIAIKGAAGPFTVVATNFAPGTTAADIESAVANDGADGDGNNTLVSCCLTSTHRDSTVTAELVYSDRAVAEKIDEGDVDMLSSDSAPDRYNSSRETEAAARTRLKEHRRGDPDLQDERYPNPSDSEPHLPVDGGEDALQRGDEAGQELSRSSPTHTTVTVGPTTIGLAGILREVDDHHTTAMALAGLFHLLLAVATAATAAQGEAACMQGREVLEEEAALAWVTGAVATLGEAGRY